MKSLKLEILFDIDCCGPCATKPIAVFIAYQKIEDLDIIFTRTSAMAERMIAYTSE